MAPPGDLIAPERPHGLVLGKSLERCFGRHPLSHGWLNSGDERTSPTACLTSRSACLGPPGQGHISIGMTSSGLIGFSYSRTLPAWPFLGREGFLAPLEQPSDCHSDRKGFPALQRTRPSRRVADFSIRSILALDGSEGEGENRQEKPSGDSVERTGAPKTHAWICCTHFRPPSFPKTKQVGSPSPTSRSPRVPFSATQLGTLENSFQQTRYLSTGQVRDVALLLGLTENRVKIWFQNRRAREKRDFLKQHSSSRLSMSRNPLECDSPLGWR